MDGIKLNQQRQEEYQFVETWDLRGIFLTQCTLRHGEEKKINEAWRKNSFDTAADDGGLVCPGENADTCVCGWERLFCFLLYLISRGEFPSSHPDHCEV
jgi:hypothetical protein